MKYRTRNCPKCPIISLPNSSGTGIAQPGRGGKHSIYHTCSACCGRMNTMSLLSQVRSEENGGEASYGDWAWRNCTCVEGREQAKQYDLRFTDTIYGRRSFAYRRERKTLNDHYLYQAPPATHQEPCLTKITWRRAVSSTT